VLFSGSSPKGKTRSAGAILAGFGLLFVGIDHLQTGMEGVSWNLDAIGGSGFGWQWILAGSGILMSIVMQSSSAAATLVALNAGSLTFDQARAMIVGQSVGTAATSAMAAIGAGLAVRRAALAHIVYNVAVGIVGILLLGPLAAAGRWAGARVDDPDGVLALAAFSSIFKLVGILAFYPWLDGFSRFIERISGRGTETAVSRLDPVLAEAGGGRALEAAWRAILQLAHGAVDAVRGRLAGEPVRYDPSLEAVRQIEQFLESLSLETLDLATFEPRLVRLCHALDHLTQLNEDLTSAPPEASGWQPPAGFEEGAQALAAWLDTTQDPEAAPGATISKAMEDASKRLADERRCGRDKILQDVALQRLSAETARTGLDMLAWADSAFYHAWRLAESLRIASGNQPAAS
jgi:phosphate:Na+ symporter